MFISEMSLVGEQEGSNIWHLSMGLLSELYFYLYN